MDLSPGADKGHEERRLPKAELDEAIPEAAEDDLGDGGEEGEDGAL